MNTRILAVATLAAAFAAPLAAETSPAKQTATATLLDAKGAKKAEAVLTQSDHGVTITARVSGMAPGNYAVHIHQTGVCTPTDFASAGPHFNPTGAKHGLHKGDLPNIGVDDQAGESYEASIHGATLTGGAMPILDADGAALVIHANQDDGVTDPSGSSGARIACGAIVTK